jgi:hypothetical protein
VLILGEDAGSVDALLPLRSQEGYRGAGREQITTVAAFSNGEDWGLGCGQANMGTSSRCGRCGGVVGSTGGGVVIGWRGRKAAKGRWPMNWQPGTPEIAARLAQ